MTKPRGVDREFYDEMKARAERAESELAQYRAMYGTLVQTVVEFKRHEMAMHPQGFDPASLDPMGVLGPKTQAAIEEHSNGDPEHRNYLRNYALSEYQKRKDVPADEVDDTVSNAIIAGDD